VVGSVYRVEIEPCLGLRTQRATAFAVRSSGPDEPASNGSDSIVLVTAAHSLEQASGAMIRDRRDRLRRASVLVLDPAKDIAVLAIDDDFGDEGFALTEPSPDTPVDVVTFADIEGPEIKTGTIARRVNATLDGEGRRKAVELADIDIDAGDSGAPVVNEDGDAVAMVFAAARAEERAWAISALELRDAVAVALDPTTDPSGLSCARNGSDDAEGG
jgi:S1-C subfamily serine protease